MLDRLGGTAAAAPEKPAAKGGAGATPAAEPPKRPEQAKLQFLEKRERLGELTAQQETALGELRSQLGIEAPAVAAPKPVGNPPASDGGQAAPASAAKRKSVLDRLGDKPSAEAAKRARPEPMAASSAAAVERAANTEEVFRLAADADTRGGSGELSVHVAALRRFAELVQSAGEYEAARRGVVHNQAFHLLLGNLGAVLDAASSADICDVLYALQVLNYPRDKTFRQEPLLRRLVERLLSCRSVPAHEVSTALWSLAKLRVRQMEGPLLEKLCDAVPRDPSLASLDGETVGQFFWALSARDERGQPLFGGFRHDNLVRALLANCSATFARAPTGAFIDVVDAYASLGAAFDERKPDDMKSVSEFLQCLEARAQELTVEQLLRVLRCLRDFPSSSACAAVGGFVRGVSAVLTAWSQGGRLSAVQLCHIAAEVNLSALSAVDSQGADTLLQTAAGLLEPSLGELASNDLFDLCAAYVLAAVDGQRAWANPIFNHAANTWLSHGAAELLDQRTDRLVRLGKEFGKCRQRPASAIPAIRDIGKKLAAELEGRGLNASGRDVADVAAQLKTNGWLEEERRQEPAPLRQDSGRGEGWDGGGARGPEHDRRRRDDRRESGRGDDARGRDPRWEESGRSGAGGSGPRAEEHRPQNTGFEPPRRRAGSGW